MQTKQNLNNQINRKNLFQDLTEKESEMIKAGNRRMPYTSSNKHR